MKHSHKQKPKTLTVREYYFGPETKKKIKFALLSALAVVIRTVDTFMEPIVYFLIEVHEAGHDMYLRVTGRWYCNYCNKLHSRRVVKYTHDDYGAVCSLCPPPAEPDAYEDCIEALKALDTEAKRFDKLMQVIQEAAAKNPMISVEINSTTEGEVKQDG